MTEHRTDPVEQLVRSIVGDMMDERGWLGGVGQLLRQGCTHMDDSFAAQAAQRVADAIRAGAVLDGKGSVITPEKRRG